MGNKRHLIQHLKGGSEVVTVFCLDLAGLCRTQGCGRPSILLLCVFQRTRRQQQPRSSFRPSRSPPSVSPASHEEGNQLLLQGAHTAHRGWRAGGTEGEGRLCTVLVGPFASAGSSVFLLFPTSCPLFPSLTACLAGFRPQHHIPKKQPHTGCITSIQTYVRSDSYNNSSGKIYSSFGCAWSLRLCRLLSSCGPRCRGKCPVYFPRLLFQDW